jgi:hypothetical protein
MAPSASPPSQEKVEKLVNALDWGVDKVIRANFDFDRFRSDVKYGHGILSELTKQFDSIMLAARPFKQIDVQKYDYFCWFQSVLFKHWKGFHHANEAIHGWCVCTNHYKPKAVVMVEEEKGIVDAMAHISIN